MAFLASAPDQGGSMVYGGGLQLSRSMSIPASYRSTAMSLTTDSMSLEKLTVGTTGTGAGAFSSRSATTSPTGSYWGQDMVQMLTGGGEQQQQQQLLGSGMVSSDWQQLMDTKPSPSYKYLPPVAMAPASSTRGALMENSRIRDMMAGRKAGGWGAVDGGITVDPSKGGLALQPAVGLATSHCLAQFTSDPAFAERAAKFSSFGNNGRYPQIALPLPVTSDAAGKSRSRSAESGGRLSRTSSSSQNINNNNNSGSKKFEMEETATKGALGVASATAAAAAAAAAAERSCDMDVDGGPVRTTTLIDDKSPPGAARVQPELEAIEGASLAGAMDTTVVHELAEAPAAREPTNSCSAEQQAASVQRGGQGSISPAASPARSPSGSDDSERRKRKNSSDCKSEINPKAVDVVDSISKRWRGEKGEKDDAKAKAERSCSDNSGDSGSPRAHKESTGSHKNHKDLSKQDYIHVRARRGQATDSHSLAERVRREKISERMKYLQDLVPGCSKVTGKAVMLDEIINYVQSLQRQVESLSMKLASVNPGPSAARLDYSFESALNKDLMQSQRMSGSSSLVESTATFNMLQHQQQQQQGNNSMQQLSGGHCGLDFRAMGASSLDGYLRRSNSVPTNVPPGLTSVDTFSDDVSQSIGWDGELQSIVNPMGYGHQGRFGSSMLEGLHSAQLPVGHMKVEM